MKILLPILLMLSVAGCSKEKKHGDYYTVFNGLSDAKTFEEAAEYYTPATVDLAGKASRSGLVDRKDMLSLLPLFSGRARVRILEEKASGDTAVVTVRYTDHPVENMVGYDMEIRLSRQGGKWKINYENELKNVVDRINEKKEQQYIREKVQPYQ